MLARVAESLHWMARYVERAEDLTRALAVHFHALLDAPGDARQGWSSLVSLTGAADAFHARHARPEDADVCAFFVCDDDNPNAVATCVARARENARAVRDQISSEMWEHLNRLYFAVKEVRAQDFARGPYEFYRLVRDGAHTLHGCAHATMAHGDAYHFIQLGKHLERATQTVRLLGVRYGELSTALDGTAVSALQLIAILKSCSAFEPFRQTAGSHLAAADVVDFLLLHRRFPRAVLCCLSTCAQSLEELAASAPGAAARPDPSRQALGRLRSELEYLDLRDVPAARMDAFLEGLLRSAHRVGDEIARTFFSTQVILPESRAGARAAHQQQQQQQ